MTIRQSASALIDAVGPDVAANFLAADLDAVGPGDAPALLARWAADATGTARPSRRFLAYALVQGLDAATIAQVLAGYYAHRFEVDPSCGPETYLDTLLRSVAEPEVVPPPAEPLPLVRLVPHPIGELRECRLVVDPDDAEVMRTGIPWCLISLGGPLYHRLDMALSIQARPIPEISGHADLGGWRVVYALKDSPLTPHLDLFAYELADPENVAEHVGLIVAMPPSGGPFRLAKGNFALDVYLS